MKISAHIMPRRVILALIMILGFGLRLWGLAWGTDQSGALPPDEWTRQVIEGLSFGHPTYHGVWTQAFFSLAAMVRWTVSNLAGWLGVWLGEVRTGTELAISARLAGRLTAALLGGAQVWVAYLVGRRFFDSVATGLLAAAVLAVSPLLVAQSHYLSLDVPLGLAVMFCLWTVWKICDAPGYRSLFLAGLALGLTLTTKASGVLVLPVFMGAYVLAIRREEPGWRHGAIYWPACWLAGLCLGLVLGYPGFLLHLPEVGDVLSASLNAHGASDGGVWSSLAGRWSSLRGVLGQAVGPELVLLWLVAAGLMAWRRQWPRLLLLIFPPLYILAGLTVLKGSVEGQQAVWLPVAALAACWPLVVACRRLPGRWWPVAGVTLLGFILCALPLWRSLGVGYLFWQQDTFASARFWLQANLPPGAPLLAGPRGPLNLFPGAMPLPAQPARLPADWARTEPSYLVLTTLGSEGETNYLDPSWRQLASGYELVKRFDLRTGWGLEGGVDGPGLPRWVSPGVEVYVNRKPSVIRQPLALARPPVGVDRTYAVVHADNPAYSRAEDTMWLKHGELGQRVLRSQEPLGELGLTLSNHGHELAVAQVRQGFFTRRQVSLYPGQELVLPLDPVAWPSVAQGLYPVRVTMRRGGDLLARLVWDPLLLGRQALEKGEYARASQLLQQAFAKGGGLEAQALLAGAQARLGQWEEAGRNLAELAGGDGEPVRSYLALASDEVGAGSPAWLERLGRFSGYDGALLRQSTSRAYLVQGPQCQSEGQEVPLSGDGYHGSYLRRPGQPGQPGGHLRLWLATPMPEGQFRVELRLVGKGAAGGGALAQAGVWVHDIGGSRLLSSRRVTAADLPGGQGLISLPAPCARQGGRLEVRLDFFSAFDLRLQELTVGVDLAAHMRHVLRWYHDANGRVAQQAGRFAAAAASFEALLELDPGFNEAYLPLAQALFDSGRLEQAYKRVRKAEELYFSQPEPLARVRELYQVLHRDQDQARVDRRLRDLRPSLKREARFANGLALLGYDQGQSVFQRGQQVDLSYYWRVWAKPPLNYYIFVHLKGPDRIITFDHLLDHGRQPMPGLAVGGVVREDYRVTIPADAPPGRYHLLLGMWDPAFTGNRVPVSEGEGQGGDEVVLTTVQIR